MLKKFLVGTVVAVALLVGVSASAAYDFGPTTLKVGVAKSQYVMNVQTVVGATVDGSFGPMTKAKVMAWQASHGLVADGVVGPATKNAMNAGGTVSTTCPAGSFDPMTGKACGTTTTLPAGCMAGYLFSPTTGASCTGATVSTGALTGGAGDAELTHYSTSEKSTIKEGEEGVKVLGFKVEAMDSDVSVNFVKVELSNINYDGNDNIAGNTDDTSEKVSNYVDSVDVMMGSTKIGSADVSDFTRTSDSPDLYSKTIALTGAVVREGDKDPFYLVFNAADGIDTEDMTAKISVKIPSFRFADATGVVFTNDATGTVSNDVTLDDVSSDDKADLKSSSSNPDDVTVTVDANDTTDEELALAFKLDIGDDSSDVTFTEIAVVAKIVGAGAGVTSSESVIDTVVLKLDGKEITADVTDSVISNDGADTAKYTFDLDGEDVVFSAGDLKEAKVYVTFAEQDGNYADGATKVTLSIAKADISAETDNDDTFTTGGSISLDGAELTLSTSAVIVSNISWTKSEGTGAASIDLFFSLEAGDNDIATFAIGDVISTKTNITTSVLTKISGTATESAPGSGIFAIGSGDTANFRVRYTVTPTGGEVNLTSIKGQTVPDAKKLSPTAYFQ